MNHHSARIALICLLALFLAALPFAHSTQARPPLVATPSVTIDAPANVLLGENFSFTVTFTNTGDETGYGPFIDVVLPATGVDGAVVGPPFDGITFLSASHLGQPVNTTVLTFPAGTGCVDHPYALEFPTNSPKQVCGTPGDQLVVIELPFGSFVSAQPPAVVTINAALSNLADVGVPLNIRARGGFQFGLTPVNDYCCDPTIQNPDTDPGPTWPTAPVTPQLITLTKTYIGPNDQSLDSFGANGQPITTGESETATGPNYPRRYRITVDIPDGQTLTNLDITDILPDNMQFLSLISVTGNGTTTITDISTPSTTTPGGTLTRRLDTVVGTAADSDAEMIFEFYIPLNNAAGTPVINPANGDDVTSPNNASASGTWTPIDPRDLPATVVTVDEIGPEHTLIDKSIAIQKSVRNLTDDAYTPGDTLEYTLNFQISDFFTFGDLIVTDVISDGQRYVPGSAQITVTERGATIPLSSFPAGNLSVVLDSPGTGRTTLTFDVSGALVALGAPDGILQGGRAVAPDTGPTGGTITFQTVIQQDFSDTFPSGDPSVDHGDVLWNLANIEGTVRDNADITTVLGTKADDTVVAVSIAFGVLTKSVYAVNGSTSFSTPVVLRPGDTVTYRLYYTLPTSDFEDLVITDYLPLPIFDVSTFSTTFIDVIDAAAPAAGTAKFGPDETLRSIAPPAACPLAPDAGTGVPCIEIDTAANSIRFIWGDFDDPNDTDTAVDVLFTVLVNNQPTADRLYLTNQARVEEGTTNAGVQILDEIIQVQLTQPLLRFSKGIVATDRPGATFFLPPWPPIVPGVPGPVTFNAPGTGGPDGGAPRWSGIINSTNLAANPIDANITGVDAGDIVTFALVIMNEGTSANGAFDIRITDTLHPQYQIPASGLNLRVSYGNPDAPATPAAGLSWIGLGGGTAEDLFGSGIELVDPGTTQGLCQSFDNLNGLNVIVITYDLELRDSVRPDEELVNTGSIINYANTEGGPSFVDPNSPISDTATILVSSPALTKTIIDTNQPFTTGNNVTVGEMIRYQLVLDVPEGQMQNAALTDTLDPGLAIVSLDSISASAPLSTSVGTFTDVLNNATAALAAPGSTVTFDFGTLTNNDLDNTTTERITIEYTVVALNSAPVQRGATLNNRAELAYTGGPSPAISAAAPVVVVEPTLLVSKTPDPTTGDAGDLITFTITIQHAPASNADAFNLSLSDVIPAEFNYVGGSLQDIGPTPATTLNLAANTITATWDSFPLGSVAQLTFQITIDGFVTPGQVITNQVNIQWTSLPGDVTTPQSPYNGVSTERTGDTGNPGGVENDYRAAGSGPVTVTQTAPVKSITATSEPHTAETVVGTGTTAGRRVAIGEIVRYRLEVRLPESTMADFQLQDFLPTGLRFLNDDTARVALVCNGSANCITSSTLSGAGLVVSGDETTLSSITPTFVLPDDAVSASATTNDDNYGSGTDVFFKLGTLVNNDRDPDQEFAVVEFNALVENVSGNQAGTPRNNAFQVRINGSLVGSASVQDSSNRVVVAEPVVTVTKSISPATGPYDAGDIVTFTLVLTNATGINVTDAFDLQVTDVFDSFLTIQSVTESTTSGSCGATPAVASSAVVGQDFTGTVTCLNPGATATFTITTRVNASVPAGQEITNAVDLVYTSLPGSNGTSPNPTGSTTPGAPGTETGERDGSGGVNDYADSDSLSFSIDTPQIDKLDPSPLAYTIGDVVTYNILVTVPEGVTQNLRVTDALPDGLAYETVQVITAAAASGGLLTADFNGTLPAPTVSGGTGSGVDVTFDFGNVTAADDNNAANNRFLVQLTARVLNELAPGNNQIGATRSNAATLIYTHPVSGETTVNDATPPADITIAEPRIETTKTLATVTPPGPVQAGSVLTYTVRFANTGTSTAYDVTAVDTLPTPAGVVAFTALTGCEDQGSGNVPSTATPVGNTITFDGNPAGSWDIAPGGFIECTYTVTVQGSILLNGTYTNVVDADWSSQDGTGTPQERVYDDTTAYLVDNPAENLDEDSASFDTPGGLTLAKSDNGTAAATIGQAIDYTLTVTGSLGTVRNLVIEDALPVGMIYEVGSAAISGIAGPAAPTVTGPNDGGPTPTTLTWDFGDVEITASPATITFRAIVANVIGNQAGLALTNTATLNHDDAAGNPQPELSGSDGFSIVEPAITLDKSIASISSAPELPEAGDTVTYQIVIAHPGGPDTSTAYDVVFTDPLPAAQLDLDVASVSVTLSGGAAGVTDTSNDATNTVNVTIAQIPAGGSVTITYTATVVIGVAPGDLIDNTGRAEWSSLLGAVNPGQPDGERDGSGGVNDYFATSSTSFIIRGPSIVKALHETSAAHTPGAEVTIGEIAYFDLLVTLPESTVTTLVLTDLVPDGMAYVGGSVQVITSAATPTTPPLAANFSGTLPAPVVNPAGDGADGQDVTVTFSGPFVVPADGDSTNNSFVVRLGLRVLDVAGNVGLTPPGQTVLTNNASMDVNSGAVTDDSNPVEVTVVEPRPEITKSITPETVAINDVVTVTLVLRNTGTSAAYDMVLEDALSPRFGSITEGITPTGFTFNLTGNTVTYTSNPGFAVPLYDGTPATEFVFTFTATVLGPSPYPDPGIDLIIDNLATVTQTTTLDGDVPGERNEPPVSDQASLTVTAPDLVIAKSDSADPVTAGSPLIYTLSVTNNGPVDASGVTVVDTLPAGVTLVSTATTQGSCTPVGATITCALGDLAVGASVTITINVTVNASTTGTITNTATVSAAEGDRDESDTDVSRNTDSEDTTIAGGADLAITKTDGQTTYTPGDPITYTIVVTNNGPSAVTGAAVTDTLPAAITGVAWTCTASAGSACGDPDGTGNTIATTVDLLVGGTATYTVTGTVDPGATGNLVNTAEVQPPAGVTDPIPGNNTATDISVPPGAAAADLAITKTDGQTTYTPGAPITYTIVVTNNGPDPVTGAAVTDTLPAAITGVTWTCTASAGSACGDPDGTGNTIATTVDLLVGGTATYTVTGTVDPGATGDLVNTAEVQPPAGVTDPVPGNNTATDTDAPPGTPTADLRITKTDGQTTYTPGAPLTYTIVVTNDGPNPVVGARVLDTFPPQLTGITWTCTTSAGSICGAAGGAGNIDTTVNLAVNGTATFTVNATVDPGATGNLINTAEVQPPAGITDPTPGNNTATDIDTPPAPGGTLVDLAISKDDGQATYTAPGTLTYTILVTNNGPGAVVGAPVTDTFPPELTDITWTCTVAPIAPANACADPSGTGNISTTVNLAAGATATFTVEATIPAGTVSIITNTATVGVPEGYTDTVPENNADTDVTAPTGTPVADLAVTKDDGQSTYTPGGPITYTIVVTNLGPDAVVGATVTDAFPPEITGVTWTCTVAPADPGNSCAAVSGTGDITTTVNLISGGTATFIVNGTVAPDAVGGIVNVVTVAPPPGVVDPRPGNNQAVDANFATADLAITKTDNQTEYTPGSPVTYAIVVTNNGPDAVVGAAVTDTFPPEITNVSWTCAVAPASPGNSCAAASGTGDIAIAVSLEPGASATFIVTGTIDPGASGDLVNIARVAPPPGVVDLIEGNNTAIDIDTPLSAPGPQVGVADPGVVKLGEPSLALPGETVRFTITVTNSGSVPATGVVVSDTVPDPFIVTSASAEQGTFSIEGNRVTFFVGTVNPGQVIRLVIVTRVREDIQPPLNVTNEATLTDDAGNRRTATSTIAIIRRELPATGERRAAPPAPEWLMPAAVLLGAGALVVWAWHRRRHRIA